MSYQKLSKALNDSVKMYTPDVLYPRECLIVNVNENDTLKIKVNIGENIYLDEVRYIGIPKIYTTGLFIPLNNNYDEGYCICYNETTESLTENVIINNYSDSVTEEVNEVKESEEETSDEISNETSEEEQTNINYDRRYAKINHTHTENIGTIEDLKTLIKNTKEGNILSLDKNFKNERYGNIIINKKITIDGNGHSIENISFTCDTDEIELNNIVFFNVTTNRVNGGALQLNGQRISINNCIFYNNIINGTSVYEGGAISVNNSSVETKIVDCYFISNFCSNNGGAIRWIANDGILIGCKFIGNTATNSGGAIKWLGTNGLIKDCLFENNESNNAKDILTTDENLMGIGNKFLTESDIIGSEKFYDYITEFDKKEIENEIHSSFGRNILYNTQEMIVSTPPNNISYTEEFRKNKVVYFDNESSNPNGYRDWYYDIAIDEFNYNDEFTFSFWVKSDKKNIGKIKAYFTGGIDYIKTKVIDSNGYDSLNVFSDGHITFDVNDGWKKCFVIWKLNSTGARIYKRAIIRIYDGAKIYLSSPKLERGKVSTDWTPNPNDKISKSNISGLIKNDGTVDTTSYSTFDGNYNNLTNKPSIPSKTSDLNNDSGLINSNSIINNDNLCDYKTLITLVDEGGNISDVSFEDYDFDIIFKINPKENDCQGSVEIGDPAFGGVYIQYSNQEIHIQTQSGDEFNIALNMNSENIVKIKQDKTTNDLIITVNDYEVVSTDNSEITKNIMMITSSVGTISNFGVKTCTRIITEATINAPTNKNFITTSFTPSKLINYDDEIEHNGIVNNHNTFTVKDGDWFEFDFGCQNNEYYEFDITTSKGYLSIYSPKFTKKYCELYRDDTYKIKITHNELLIVEGTTVDGITTVDISNSNGILNFSTSVVCQFDFSNKKWYHEATFFDKIYPIGSVHITTNSVNPSNYFDGEWERIQDTFLLASGTTYENGSTGGSATVTLTANQSGVPQHTHTYAHTDTTYKLNTTNRKPGTSTAVAYGTSITATANNTTKTSNNNTSQNATESHNNMPPYLVVYMWERVG